MTPTVSCQMCGYATKPGPDYIYCPYCRWTEVR